MFIASWFSSSSGVCSLRDVFTATPLPQEGFYLWSLLYLDIKNWSFWLRVLTNDHSKLALCLNGWWEGMWIFIQTPFDAGQFGVHPFPREILGNTKHNTTLSSAWSDNTTMSNPTNYCCCSRRGVQRDTDTGLGWPKPGAVQLWHPLGSVCCFIRDPWILWRQILGNCPIRTGNCFVIAPVFSDKLLCLMKRICFLT